MGATVILMMRPVWSNADDGVRISRTKRMEKAVGVEIKGKIDR